jgi:hypothetical protein
VNADQHPSPPHMPPRWDWAGPTRISRIGGIACLALLPSWVTACKPSAVTPAAPAPAISGRSQPFGTQTSGLPLCPAGQSVSLIMRIHLHGLLDDIFDPISHPKEVYYDSPGDEGSNTAEFDARHRKGTRNFSNDASITANLYHSDLSTVDAKYSLKSGDVIEYRVIIDQAPGGGHGDNMKFWEGLDGLSSPQKIRGVGVNPTNNGDIICSDEVTHDEPYGNTKYDVAVFYLKYKGGSSPNLDPFSIVIVPRTGGVDTSVLIDPKILNNG